MKARQLALAVLSVAVAASALTACAPEGSPAPTGSIVSPTPINSDTPDTTASPSPSASSTAAAVAIPNDCRAILSATVLAELKDVPLNDPAFGPSGVAADGSLTCIWANPGADTTNLTTKISRMSRGPALDMLNGLAATEGFTCYTPDGGTRCEKTYPNPKYPVTDGRTLFWRDDVLIDTRFSNLAPSGYTASIVAHIFA
ncbi:MAG: hypothetical protein KKH75_04150 [Actinobacteria bacterium]|nr:hypothetical protein [Actinomycetota bacterium]